MARSGIVVGLMSGTSADGVDACIAKVAVEGTLHPTLSRRSLLYFRTYPYGRALRNAILGVKSVEEVCRLNFVVAQAFADAALRAIRQAGLTKRDVLAVASHGQSVYHAPDDKRLDGWTTRSTLQIGDPSVIAALTGIQTVGDFRAKDVALGGQGAPLVPFVEWLLTPSEGAAWLNVGGIANVTVVPPHAKRDDIIAFDTGPGNTLLDRVIRGRTNGRRAFDKGGELGLTGRVDEALVRKMLTYRYFRRKPPKSTGPEEFGAAFLRKFRPPRRTADALATLAALTADSIARGILAATPGARPKRLIASGGGIYNRAVMARLALDLPGTRIVTSEDFGIPPDAKEAFAFAVLGLCTLAGIPNNLPSVTGASRPAVLGVVARPE